MRGAMSLALRFLTVIGTYATAGRRSLITADSSRAAEDAPAEAPAPAVAAEPEVGMPLWTVLANPVIYGLPNFTVS